MRKCSSNSAFISRGVARKAGECSQVNVSAEVTLLAKRWFAEVAQRKVEKACQCGPSPSGSATNRWLDRLTARGATGLRTEFGVTSGQPGIDLREVIFVDQLGQSLSPVVANSFRFGVSAGHQLRQMGKQIVTAAAFKFRGEIRRPIGAIGFERIGEDGVGRGQGKRFDQRLTDRVKVRGYGLVAERIQNPAFGAHGSTFYLLPGMAGDENKRGARSIALG